MEDCINQLVLSFLSEDSFKFSIPDEYLHKIFSDDNQERQKSTALFFGSLNRILRRHCIETSEYITMMKQYGFIPAILSAWDRFSNSISLLSDQISRIFVENGKQDIRIPSGFIIQQIKSQILNSGYMNWKKYVLDQRFIAVEVPSSIELLAINPISYPFSEVSFYDHTLKIINLLPDQIQKPNKTEYYLTLLLSKFIYLFYHHPALYPQKIKSELKEISTIADTLYVYMRYDFTLYLNLKRDLIVKLQRIQTEVKNFQPHTPDSYSIFDNHEYLSLLKMIFLCNPDEYIKRYIPNLVSSFPAYRVPQETYQDRSEFLTNTLLPLFNKVMKIIDNNSDAVLAFSTQFSKRFLKADVISQYCRNIFEGGQTYLHTYWTMMEHLPQNLITFSDAFINYYSDQLARIVEHKNEEAIQEMVATINGLVDAEFHRHPTMVFARSKLFIPHQKDDDLIGRALVLIEQAHNPSKKNYSIAELFDIVPFVKNKRELFKGIASFVQNQLLSKANPNVESEKLLIDALGQYAESEFIRNIQELLVEFAGRYTYFYEISKISKLSFPPQLSIAVLSNTRWKQIVQRGKLNFFHQFEPARKFFEDNFKKQKANSNLIWCDPSSVVEIRLRLGQRFDLFLFNGVQYSIIRLILLGSNNYQKFVKLIVVEDLPEQLSTLVDTGLVQLIPGTKDQYKLAESINEKMNRNFALKFTSAENLALLKMKEFDRRKAVNSMIVKAVKQAGGNGIKMSEIIRRVLADASKYFSVPSELIREQARELEVTKYIALRKGTDDIFEFIAG